MNANKGDGFDLLFFYLRLFAFICGRIRFF